MPLLNEQSPCSLHLLDVLCARFRMVCLISLGIELLACLRCFPRCQHLSVSVHDALCVPEEQLQVVLNLILLGLQFLVLNLEFLEPSNLFEYLLRCGHFLASYM